MHPWSAISLFGKFNIDDDNLRELFYYRHPGDAPVKVGSEREFASRQDAPTFAKIRGIIIRQTAARTKSWFFYHFFARGDPPKLALS